MPYEELVIPSIYPICCDATGTQPRQQPLPTDYTTAPSNNGIKSTKTVTNVLAPMHFASCGLIGIGTLPRIEALLSKTIPTRKENRDSSPKTDNIFFCLPVIEFLAPGRAESVTYGVVSWWSIVLFLFHIVFAWRVQSNIR